MLPYCLHNIDEMFKVDFHSPIVETHCVWELHGENQIKNAGLTVYLQDDLIICI